MPGSPLPAASSRKWAPYPKVTESKFHFGTVGTLPAKTPVTYGQKPKQPYRKEGIEMWMDITRGMAVLKAAWSFGSTDNSAETTPVAELSNDVSGEYLAEAQSYLNMGRHHSAAILAGDALQEALRRLCDNNSIALKRPTVDSMISELARNGVYDSLVEQQLSELTGIYEKAVTGLWSEVSKDDVESMLRDLRAFVVEHSSN
jgi:hypothetical protein